jgi:hypothetical protein
MEIGPQTTAIGSMVLLMWYAWFSISVLQFSFTICFFSFEYFQSHLVIADRCSI